MEQLAAGAAGAASTAAYIALSRPSAGGEEAGTSLKEACMVGSEKRDQSSLARDFTRDARRLVPLGR